MLDEEKVLVLNSKKEDITSKIILVSGSKVVVRYANNKTYNYNTVNLRIIYNPILLDDCIITTTTKKLTNVVKALNFDGYIKVFFKNGTSRVYYQSEVVIEENLLKQIPYNLVFSYLREMASHLKIADVSQTYELENPSSDFLSKLYEKVNFVNSDSVIKIFVSGISSVNFNSINQNRIFPFSFNLSQKRAVKNAFSNRISVIEGPPGTGKTQTILNIIANAVINEKTVAVLSNNNSATDNVFEKLEKNNLGSICAKLGKKDNIDLFLMKQSEVEVYPKAWDIGDRKVQEIKEYLISLEKDIEFYLSEKNDIAILKQELEELELEQKYFMESIDIQRISDVYLPDFTSEKLHDYLLFLNKQKNKKDYFSRNVQLLSYVKFGFLQTDLYQNRISEILDCIELTYYKKRINELEITIKNKEDNIKDLELERLFSVYTEESMKIFKCFVYKKYNNKSKYDSKNVKRTEQLVKDYPIILSTTYSLLNCVDRNFMFDYMIIDESSQVDLVSAFPALTVAKKCDYCW